MKNAMKDKDDLKTLVKENDGFGMLVKAAVEMPAVGDDLERRVMMNIARRAVERSRLRVRRGVIASLSGLAMLFAGCVAAVVVWFPILMPDFSRMSWLDRLREIPLPEFLDSFSAAPVAATEVPLVEQWGGLLLIVFLIAGAVGFVWYLNSLFSSDPVRD